MRSITFQPGLVLLISVALVLPMAGCAASNIQNTATIPLNAATCRPATATGALFSACDVAKINRVTTNLTDLAKLDGEVAGQSRVGDDQLIVVRINGGRPYATLAQFTGALKFARSTQQSLAPQHQTIRFNSPAMKQATLILRVRRSSVRLHYVLVNDNLDRQRSWQGGGRTVIPAFTYNPGTIGSKVPATVTVMAGLSDWGDTALKAAAQAGQVPAGPTFLEPLATQACAATIIVQVRPYSAAKRRLGQEALCMSVGLAYAAAHAELSAQRYISMARQAIFSGLPGAPSALVLSVAAYTEAAVTLKK